MAGFDIFEVIDIIVTIVIAGYILAPLARNNLKKSFIISGLSIVLHELSHKLVATLSGFTAVYHANYTGLIIGLVLRMLGAPVFFVPAYVSITGNGASIGYLLTALAGPLTNLAIFGATTIMLKNFPHVKWIQDNDELINSLRIINMWLSLINLLPIPGTDGYNAIASLRYL